MHHKCTHEITLLSKTTLIRLKTSFQLLVGSFQELNYSSRAVDFRRAEIGNHQCFVCVVRAKAATRLYHKLGRREISHVMRVLCDFARPHAVCMHAMGSSREQTIKSLAVQTRNTYWRECLRFYSCQQQCAVIFHRMKRML